MVYVGTSFDWMGYRCLDALRLVVLSLGSFIERLGTTGEVLRVTKC